MTDVKDLRLVDTLSNSLEDQELFVATAEAGQVFFDSWASQSPKYLLDLTLMTSTELDYLAYQFGADVWRDSWPQSRKVSVLRDLAAQKRIKGTRAAVEQAVSRLGSSAVITEWWETSPKGTPHTFTIDIAVGAIEGQIPEDVQSDVIRAIDEAKPVRSSYTFNLNTQVDGEWGVYGEARPFSHTFIVGTTNNTKG